jgi:hypothetical protein
MHEADAASASDALLLQQVLLKSMCFIWLQMKRSVCGMTLL